MFQSFGSEQNTRVALVRKLLVWFIFRDMFRYCGRNATSNFYPFQLCKRNAVAQKGSAHFHVCWWEGNPFGAKARLPPACPGWRWWSSHPSPVARLGCAVVRLRRRPPLLGRTQRSTHTHIHALVGGPYFETHPFQGRQGITTTAGCGRTQIMSVSFPLSTIRRGPFHFRQSSNNPYLE